MPVRLVNMVTCAFNDCPAIVVVELNDKEAAPWVRAIQRLDETKDDPIEIEKELISAIGGLDSEYPSNNTIAVMSDYVIKKLAQTPGTVMNGMKKQCDERREAEEREALAKSAN